MPIRIKKTNRRISCRYPAGCDITGGRVNTVTDENPTNDDGDDTDSDYNSSKDVSDTSDPPPEKPNKSNPDDDSIADLYGDYDAILLNPDVVDHHRPISIV